MAVEQLANLVASVQQHDFGVRVALFVVGFSERTKTEMRMWWKTDVYDVLVCSLGFTPSLHFSPC